MEQARNTATGFDRVGGCQLHVASWKERDGVMTLTSKRPDLFDSSLTKRSFVLSERCLLTVWTVEFSPI